MNDNSSDDCRFNTEVSIIKKTLADIVAQYLQAGFTHEAVIVAIGSLAGNLIGGSVQEEYWPEVFETMKAPMMADAKRAKDVLEAVSNMRS